MKQRMIAIIFALLFSITFSACKNETVVDPAQGTAKPDTEAMNDKKDPAPSDSATPIPTQSAEDNITPEVSADDHTNTIPVLMETPPFSYYLSDRVKPEDTQPIQLTMISSTSNKITDVDQWFADHNLTYDAYELPNSLMSMPGNLPDEIEQQCDNLMITAAFYDDSYIYCTYGADFSEGYILNIYDKNSLEAVYRLDFSNYRYTPEYISENFNFIQQKINWATIKDHVLFIAHSHNTYAKSSNDMNAYITAIDLSDMSILWRTDPLVSNARNFQVIDDVIISGYGFTDEPDFLYQIDTSSGKVIDQLPLKTAAEYIIKKDNVLYVRTYNVNYEFEITQ